MAIGRFSNSHLPGLPNCMGLTRTGRCTWLNCKACMGKECKFKRSEEECESSYTKSTIAEEQGRKFGQTDERYMKKAEDLLHGEFAVALGIPKESVKSYIEDKVNEIENRTAISSGGETNEHC